MQRFVDQAANEAALREGERRDVHERRVRAREAQTHHTRDATDKNRPSISPTQTAQASQSLASQSLLANACPIGVRDRVSHERRPGDGSSR